MANDAEKYREQARKIIGDHWREGAAEVGSTVRLITGPAMADRIATALSAAAADALERAAKVADLDAERTKHTSHADGIGMGCLSHEGVAHRIAAAIRALSGGAKDAKEDGRG